MLCPKSALIELDKNYIHYPNKDFVLLYNNGRVHTPQTMISTHENTFGFSTSFILNFQDLALNDEFNQSYPGGTGEGNHNEIDVGSQKGEFIILIDCSGSMMGDRISLAKEALVFFIQSLPSNSYFNIYQFGSNFSKFFKESHKTIMIKTLNMLLKCQVKLMRIWEGQKYFFLFKIFFKENL